MEFLKKLFRRKDKKAVYNLLLFFAVGIALMLVGKTFVADRSEREATAELPALLSAAESESVSPSMAGGLESAESYEERLEQRLSDILSCVENAGRVRVLLKLSYGRELIVAEDGRTEQSAVSETDNEGGARETSETAQDKQTVRLKQADGSEWPLVLKEIEPRVEGALIIAEGGDDVFVKDALIRAAYTVLGVEPHKVQVLVMQGNGQQ